LAQDSVFGFGWQVDFVLSGPRASILACIVVALVTLGTTLLTSIRCLTATLTPSSINMGVATADGSGSLECLC